MIMNIPIIKCASAGSWLYAISNPKATSEAEFMKKLSNTETELKKSVAYKKVCICIICKLCTALLCNSFPSL